MAAKLVEYVRNEQRMKLPPEDAPADLEPGAGPEPGGVVVAKKTGRAEDESALQQVLSFVRDQTGHDFTHYKRATVLRRIARRMQVNSLDSVPAYLDYLRAHADESPALLRDLLIGVTHFFRDPRRFRLARGQCAAIICGKKWRRPSARLGCGLLHWRGSLHDRHAPLRICGHPRPSAIAPDFRDRHRRKCDCRRARRVLSPNDRSRRFSGTVTPFFLELQRWLSRKERDPRT